MEKYLLKTDVTPGACLYVMRFFFFFAQLILSSILGYSSIIYTSRSIPAGCV